VPTWRSNKKAPVSRRKEDSGMFFIVLVDFGEKHCNIFHTDLTP
jgi:hypothetical protein